MIREGALLLALTVGGAAHASCYVDEKAAITATQVVTYLNACLDHPNLNDEAMLDVSTSLARLFLIPSASSVVRRSSFADPLPAASYAIALRQTKKSECNALKASPLVQAGLRRIGRWQEFSLDLLIWQRA